jgi:hypothetical protein
MRPWPIVLVAALPLLCAAAPTESADAEEYWMRSYSTGQQWSVYYNMTLKVDDLAKAADKVEALAVKAGGASASARAMDTRGRGSVSRCLTYNISSADAAKLTKQLFELGEVEQYNVNRQSTPETLREIKDKIDKLGRELDSHAVQLQDMPAAKAVLDGTLSRLKQAQAANEASGGKAHYTIFLRQQEAERP